MVSSGSSALVDWWIAAGLASRSRRARKAANLLPRMQGSASELSIVGDCVSALSAKFSSGTHRSRTSGEGNASRLLCATALLAMAGMCGGSTQVSDCRGAVSFVTESTCPSGSSTAYRYFKVTVNGNANRAYTSIVTPSGAQCSGSGPSYLCTAPAGTVTAYDVQVGQGCRADVKNNNFLDQTDRFSKQITICSPCIKGDYWIAIRPMASLMPCDFKLYLPKLNSSTANPATCDFYAEPSPSTASACTGGLKRGNLVSGEVCVKRDGYACLFGQCLDWVWLGAALGVGLVPGLIALILFCVCWRRAKVENFEAEEEIAYANKQLVNKKKDARKKYDAGSEDESDNDDENVPASFFVSDADFD